METGLRQLYLTPKTGTYLSLDEYVRRSRGEVVEKPHGFISAGLSLLVGQTRLRQCV